MTDEPTEKMSFREFLLLPAIVLGVVGPLVGLIYFVNLAAGVAFFMLIPALLFMSEARKTFQRSRRFADIPTSLLRSAAQGYVELSGRLKTKDGTFPLSPISKIPSHYWHVEMGRRKRHREASNQRWVTVNEMASARTFLPFEDDTGEAYLMIHDLTFNPSNDFAIAYPRITRTKIRDRKALDAMRNKIPAPLLKGLDGDGPWQLVERVLPAEHPLFVTGLLRTIRSNASPTLRAVWGNMLQGGKKTEWEAEMRRVEGIKSKQHLNGTQRVNVVAADVRPEFEAPLILASQHNVESALTWAHYRETVIYLLWLLFFVAILGTAIAIAMEPARLYEWREALYELL